MTADRIMTAEALDALVGVAVRSGDEDDRHLYVFDPVEGCWGAYLLADCVGLEEIALPATLLYRPDIPAAGLRVTREEIEEATGPLRFEHFDEDEIHLGPCVLIADLPDFLAALGVTVVDEVQP